MTRKERLLQNFLVGLFGTTAFVTIAIFSLIWVNGLSYDKASGTFEQTSVIAVDSKISNVTVWLNGLKVSNTLPFEKRNLNPGSYELEIKRAGFYSYEKSFHLRPGQVGLVKDVLMVAIAPLKTTLAKNYRFVDIGKLSTGLSLVRSELYDGSKLITRFSQTPEKVYRFNNAYLYLLNNEIRLYIPETSQDLLVTKTAAADPTINPKLFSWSFALKDGNSNYLVDVVESSVAAVTSP
ncbi:MAG: PEGA domain-containing protein [Patescibacteria group bacterium]